MQNQLYLTDSYQFKNQTTILACGEGEQGSWVTLTDNKSIHIYQDADMRFSYIENTENMPCGGPHVSSLGKIDQFVIR